MPDLLCRSEVNDQSKRRTPKAWQPGVRLPSCGYRRSRGPAPSSDHVAYSKRAVADDMIEVMQALGHQRFKLVGHDRGAAVALRLVLDHPSAVARAA